MIVQSYLVFPKADRFKQALDFLEGLPNCEVTQPSNNQQVIVLVAENEDQLREEAFLSFIRQHETVDHLVLVSSFQEPSKNP